MYLCPGRGSGRTADCVLVPQAIKGPTTLTLIVNPPADPDKGWEVMTKILGHAGHVNAVAFNSKGVRLASASEVRM